MRIFIFLLLSAESAFCAPVSVPRIADVSVSPAPFAAASPALAPALRFPALAAFSSPSLPSSALAPQSAAAVSAEIPVSRSISPASPAEPPTARAALTEVAADGAAFDARLSLPVTDDLEGVHDGRRVHLVERDGPLKGRVRETLTMHEVLKRQRRAWFDALDLGFARSMSESSARIASQAPRGWARVASWLSVAKPKPPVTVGPSEENVRLSRVYESNWKSLMAPWYERSRRPGPFDSRVNDLWRALVGADSQAVEKGLEELGKSGRLIHSHWVTDDDSDPPDYGEAAMRGASKPIYAIGPLEKELAQALEKSGRPGGLPQPYADVLTWVIENVQQHVLPRKGKGLLLLVAEEKTGNEPAPIHLYVLDSGPGMPVLQAMNRQYFDPEYHERGEGLGYMLDSGPRSWSLASRQEEFHPKITGKRARYSPLTGRIESDAGSTSPARTPLSGSLFSMSWPQ
ncbi:MAG: hypothetical protein ACHQ49_12955 [Elusimicrobiota bacterium]